MKKKLLSIALALLLILPVGSVFAAEDPLPFNDIENHWAKTYIVKGHDIIDGYPDKTFRPDNNITYGEFIAFMNRLFIPEYNPPETQNDWYQAHLDEALQAGYLPKGFVTDGNKYITREEVAFLINEYFDLTSFESGEKKFTDQDEIKYPQPVAKLLTLKSVINEGEEIPVLDGYPDGSFRPKGNITRGELVKVLDTLRSALNWYEPTPVDVNELKKYPSTIAMITEDYTIREQQTLYPHNEDELLNVRDLIPKKLHQNDLLLVYGQEGEYAKVVDPTVDVPRPMMLVPLDLLDKDPDHILSKANYIFTKENAPVYENKDDKEPVDHLSGAGKVVERSDDWIRFEGFGETGPYWINAKDVELQNGFEVSAK